MRETQIWHAPDTIQMLQPSSQLPHHCGSSLPDAASLLTPNVEQYSSVDRLAPSLACHEHRLPPRRTQRQSPTGRSSRTHGEYEDIGLTMCRVTHPTFTSPQPAATELSSDRTMIQTSYIHVDVSTPRFPNRAPADGRPRISCAYNIRAVKARPSDKRVLE